MGKAGQGGRYGWGASGQARKKPIKQCGKLIRADGACRGNGQPIAPQLRAKQGPHVINSDGGQAFRGTGRWAPHAMVREGCRPEAAPRLTARRFQGLAGAGNGARAQPFHCCRIQPRRSHGKPREAFRFRQRIHQAAKPAVKPITIGGKAKPYPAIAQRIGEGDGRHIPGPFGQQRSGQPGRAFPPCRIQGSAPIPTPNQRKHRHGMVFHQPSGQPIGGYALNG